MKKGLLAAVILLLLASSGFFAYRWNNAEKRLAETVAYTHSFMDSLTATVEFPKPPYATGVRDSVYWQWVATSAQLKVRKAQEVVRHWVGLRQTVIEDYEVEILKQAGLVDPPKQLREDLEAHPELIPYDQVLGGTMSFGDIILLPQNYAFADFEDGHIGGNILLSYEVKDAKITWKRLWAELL